MNAIQQWFGRSFAELHPALQQLHRNGGRLQGEVDITLGHGGSALARIAGRRLAARLGVPVDCARCGFTVDIAHVQGRLQWARSFVLPHGEVRRMVSVFEPVGRRDAGGWMAERTGPVALALDVDIVDGGWHWRMRRARVHGIPVPLALLPASHAYKRIVDGRYEFGVAFSLPLVGRVLQYRGMLDLMKG